METSMNQDMLDRKKEMIVKLMRYIVSISSAVWFNSEIVTSAISVNSLFSLKLKIKF